jgi:predicted AAA+ superfamily ATPase
MTTIKDSLLLFNPWWKDDLKIEYKFREIYDKISKFMQQPQIIAFTGLRRVGKTTLMLKIAQDYITNGFESKNIIYFTFDEFKDIEIIDIINEYERIMEKNFKDEEYLILLDEIQKLHDWENQLKVIYDRFSKKVKIIISHNPFSLKKNQNKH